MTATTPTGTDDRTGTDDTATTSGSGRGPFRRAGHRTAEAKARRRRRIIQVAALVAAVAAGLATARVVVDQLPPHLYAGTVFQESRPAPALDGLVDTDGAPVDLADHQGRVVLVYFGYTNCPDVCPATLSTAHRAIEALGDDGERVDLLLVTVDAERDDPATLAGYVAFFDPRFRGVTGPDDAVRRVASAYGVHYQRAEGAGAGYIVDHSASLLGIGPDGSLRVMWPPTVDADGLAGDVAELLS